MMMTSHRSVLWATLTAAALAASVVSGCSTLRSTQEIAVTGASGDEVESRPLAVDVQNARGTVSVWVEPGKPIAVWAADRGGKGMNHRPDWIAASLTEDNGKPVLRVLNDSQEGEPTETTIRIRVPSCAGIRVRNSGGLIDVKGVTGAIDLQNTMPPGSGMAIRAYAGGPITAPVTARTNNGSIDVRLPTGSTGAVRVHAVNGTPIVDGGYLVLTSVKMTRTDITCTVEGGENPIDLSTEDGTASLLFGR